MRIIPSKYSKPLWTQDFYEADVWGGRGRGGSHNLTLHTLYEMIKQPYFRGFFVRAIHGHIRHSLWKDFLDRIQEVSEINNYDYFREFRIKDNEMSAIYLPNKNEIFSKGFKATSKGNTAHMKSIAGATHIYGEEWEEVGEEENNKLMDSLRTTKAPIKIVRSWNAPPKDHWLVKNYYDLLPSGIDGYYKLKSKGIQGHLSLFGTYKDNIKNLDSNTVARYLRYKQTSPKYYYNQILGLVSDGGDKKVYYGWQRIPFTAFLSMEAPEVYGLDFGDVVPTSLVRVKYKDGSFYRHQVLHESLRSLNVKYGDKIAEIRQKLSEDIKDNDANNIWTKHKGLLTYVFDLIGVDKETPIFCDPAQKSLIIELRLSGYKALAATKEKAANINFINRASNFYTQESLDMEEEYNSYYLEEDVNKNAIDGKPKKSNDHSMEAQEYACRGLKDMLNIVL